MKMVVNPVNVLALIVAIVILLKALVILASPKKCLKNSAKMLKEQWGVIVAITVILAVVTGYYVVTNVGVAETAAALAFLGSVILFSYVLHPKAVMKCTKAMASDRKMCLLSLLPWAAGAVYVLYVLLA